MDVLRVSRRWAAGILLAAAMLLAGGSAALADWYEPPHYMASSPISGAQEPINIIVSERHLGWTGPAWTPTRVNDAFQTPTFWWWDKEWYDNYGCYDSTMNFHGAPVSLSLSTDDGTAGDVFPWTKCGDGERNHLRAYEISDQFDETINMRRETLYISASLETIGGDAVYDNNNNYVTDCPGGVFSPHCLTRKSFDWGRDGYDPVPASRSAWTDLKLGWILLYGWPISEDLVELDPPPTDWIWQGVAGFRSDGYAWILEDAYDFASDPNSECTASTVLPGGEKPPAEACNGLSELDDTYWRAHSNAPGEWLMLDRQANCAPSCPNHTSAHFDTVQVSFGHNVFDLDLGFCGGAKDFRIQVRNSTAVPWTTVAQITDRPQCTQPMTLQFSPRNDRYVRVLIDDNHSLAQNLVRKFKVKLSP